MRNKMTRIGAALCFALLVGACGGDADEAVDSASGDSAVQEPSAAVSGDSAVEEPSAAASVDSAVEEPSATGAEASSEVDVAAPTEMQTVSVGITSWHTWYWWLMAAREEGLMEPYGVDLDVVTFQNTGQIAAGILSDSVQIGLIAPEQTFTIQKEAPNLMLIGSNISTSPYTLLGAEDITSIEELRGATLGVTAEGASADYFTALLMLTSKGLEQGTDFNFVNAGPPAERAAAMSAGELQAVLNFEPAALQLVEEGANVLDRAADYPNLGGVEVNAFAADASWYEEHRELAENFARGYLASLDWLYDESNRDRAVELLATEMNVSDEHAQQTYERFVVELEAWDRDGKVDPERLEQTRANATEAGLDGMPEADDLEGRYDNSLMEAAADR